MKETIEVRFGDVKCLVEVSSALYKRALSTVSEPKEFQANTYTSQNIQEIIRTLIPGGDRLPTTRQLDYAQNIADTVGVAMPQEAEENADSCSLFIDEHKPRFDLIKSAKTEARRYNSTLVSDAHRVQRWSIAEEKVKNGLPLSEVAELLEVKRTSTVEGYIEKLNQWRQLTDEGFREVVLHFVSELNAGHDIEQYREPSQEQVKRFIEHLEGTNENV